MARSTRKTVSPGRGQAAHLDVSELAVRCQALQLNFGSIREQRVPAEAVHDLGVSHGSQTPRGVMYA